MQNIAKHKRSYGHPLHPNLTPDVLTCVLPLGTVRPGKESTFVPVRLFLTITAHAIFFLNTDDKAHNAKKKRDENARGYGLSFTGT